MDESTSLLSQLSANIVASARSQKPAVFPQVLACLVSCLGPFIFGLTLGYSSPAIPQLKDEGILDTDDKRSWFGSLVTVGAILGGPIAALCVGRVGRKTTVMLCCFPFSVGWLLMVFGKTYIVLYVARIVCGIGTGMTSLAVPLYIGEVTTKELRGTLGAGFQLSVTMGILLAFGLGIVLTWRWLAVVGSILTGLLVVLMLMLPETPRWLLSKHDHNAALKSLEWLRGPNINVEQECQEIAENLFGQDEGMSLREFFKPGIYKPMLISLALMVFQQMSGVNAVIFYAQSIFKGANISLDPELAAVVVAGVQVMATFLSCVVMDLLGRRILLMFAGVFMTLSCVAFGVYYYLAAHASVAGLSWLPLVSLIVYIVAFSLGWGPIPWLVMGEIFPLRVKGLASGVSTLSNWLMAFIITKEFNELQNGITRYGTYWLFAGICALGVLFVAVFMPETKGKSLEEIQRNFETERLSINNEEDDPLLRDA